MSSVESVPIDFSEHTTLPKITKKKLVYGPRPNEETYFSQNKLYSKKQVIGLYLAPAMMNALAYVGFFKALEEYKSELNLSVLSGSGWGGLLSAYYSLGERSSQMEWRFFQMFSNLSKSINRWDSSQRKDSIEAYFLKNLKGKKIQTLPKQLILPLFNPRKRKLEYFSRGKLYSKIKKSLMLSSKSFLTTPIGKNALNLELYKKWGVDKLICVSALGDDLKMNFPDGHIEGIFSKEIAFLDRAKCSLKIKLSSSLNSLDANVMNREILKSSYKTSKEKLKRWFQNLQQKPNIERP